MKDVLKPYPTYKDSGIQWLGDVPEQWQILPNRAIFFEIKERGFDKEQMLSVTISKGIISQSSLLAGSSKKDSSNEDKSNYKLVCPDDIVYNKMRAWQGAIGASEYRGIVSPAYIIIRLRRQQLSKYFHYLFRIQAFAKEAERWSYGISSDQWSLRSEEFKQIYCCIPPLPEQTAIVRYLDYIDRRIKRYINAKKKLIELLNGQKQAIIQQAVTRGLDPDVRLKPSGVEWLGSVPEHWEIVSLRYLSSKFCSGVTPRGGSTIYQQIGVPFLRSQNIHFDGLRLKNVAHIPRDLHERLAGTHVRPNDVLLNITGASIGRVCSIPRDFAEGNVNQHVCIIRPRTKQVLPEFLAAYLSIPYMQREINMEQNGASRQGLSLEAIRAFKILLPGLEEQAKIIRAMRQQTHLQDVVIEHTEYEIILLEEYRTRLIADVVTGKLDVRGEAAASLPDEREEGIIEDDIEVITDTETADEDEAVPAGEIYDN